MKSGDRAKLRSMAVSLQPILHIGKQGITDSLIAQADEALEARELIKGAVQKNAGITAKEAIQVLCAKLNCEPVQSIGNKFVIYRESKENKRIFLNV